MAEMNKGAILKSLLNELSKTHIEVDGIGRAQYVYQAASGAINGAVCLVTEYIYSGPASTTIVGMKEAEGVWDSSWDTDFTI